MKLEVYSAFPCISFRNINNGTLKNVSVDFMQAQRYQFSFLNLAHGKHILSVKTQFLRRVLSNFDHLYCRAELFFRFTASKGIIFFLKMSFESKTCIQNAQHSKSLVDGRLVENLVTSLLIGNVENNENNRGQKYPLQGG